MSKVLDAARMPRTSGAVVAGLVWRNLRRQRDFYGELTVVDADAGEVAALLPHLSGLWVDEWSGDSGIPYRDYVGELPCGLVVRVATDAELVPNLAEAGGR